MKQIQSVGLLGFGEVGTTIARHLSTLPLCVTCYDTQFEDSCSAPSESAAIITAVNACASVAEAARGSELIISAVTPDQCLAGAEQIAPALESGAWYLDLNSVSPGTRQRTATCITDAGGLYVECAVMGPIHPLGVATPMLLGGPHAAAFGPAAAALGFDAAGFFSAEIGRASAAKMCRSVMIKGMEALITEALLPARHYGVETIVLDSLQNLMPGVDWTQHARYLIERTLQHGARRSAEMEQAAHTLTEAGVEPLMTRACVTRQAQAANHAAAADQHELGALLDHMLAPRAKRST